MKENMNLDPEFDIFEHLERIKNTYPFPKKAKSIFEMTEYEEHKFFDDKERSIDLKENLI